jgi:DNA-binding transcriptional MerR regulator
MATPADRLLPIGRFARVTGLTIRALRHYDELGLLAPAWVDPETGYRYYGIREMQRAGAIRQLRDLDASLDDIRRLLEAADAEGAQDLLELHRRRVSAEITRLEDVRVQLDSIIDGRERLMGVAREPVLDAAVERQLAVDLFNHVWTLLERERRTADEDDELLHAAHASRFHWLAVGTRINAARGEWQCSRVYAVLGRAEPALHHARRCLELALEADDAEDWDVPFAHEALARAHAVAGDAAEARRHVELARAGAAEIADAEDRELVLADLTTIPV